MIPGIVIAGACRITASTLAALVPAVDAVADSGLDYPRHGRGGHTLRHASQEGAIAAIAPHGAEGIRIKRTPSDEAASKRPTDLDIDCGDRVTAERLMGRERMVLAEIS